MMDTQTLIDRLGEIVGPGNVLSSQMDLMLYSYDASLEKENPGLITLKAQGASINTGRALDAAAAVYR